MVSEKAHSPLLNALVDRSQGRPKEFGLLGVCTTLKTATKSSITRALLQILLESVLPVTASVPSAVVTCSPHAHGTGRSLNSFGISDPPSAVVEIGWWAQDLLKRAGTPRRKRGQERERESTGM